MKKVKQNTKRSHSQIKTEKVKQNAKQDVTLGEASKRAGGGTRTRTCFKAERILSPSRLPFRHPGIALNCILFNLSIQLPWW